MFHCDSKEYFKFPELSIKTDVRPFADVNTFEYIENMFPEMNLTVQFFTTDIFRSFTHFA